MAKSIDRITKLARRPGIAFGVAMAYPLLPSDLHAGMRIGVSEFSPGVVDLDLTYDEAIYMLEGEIEIDGDGTTHRLQPGDFLWMPGGRKIAYRAKAACKFLYAIPEPSNAG